MIGRFAHYGIGGTRLTWAGILVILALGLGPVSPSVWADEVPASATDPAGKPKLPVRKEAASNKAKRIAKAAQATTTSVADTKATNAEGASAKKPLPDNLKDVVAYAIANHPQIARARGRVGEARFGITVAEANNGFQLEGSTGTGYGAQSTTSVPLSDALFKGPALGNGNRFVISLTGKKLLYDFGSTDAGISRAMKLATAEEWNLASQINEIGQAMAQAYLNVVQTRELSRLNAENIKALEDVQELVKLNQVNGNGTVADVKRVEARLVDARAVASDNEAELQNAIDRFQRLVKSAPGELKPVPDLADFTPATVDAAISLLPQTSPKLRAGDSAKRATELEIEAKKASLKPQFLFQTDTTMKTYTGSYWNNFDAQAMVSMTYKFMDGGLSDGQLGQLLSRLEQDEQHYIFDRDEAEADLRKYYISIASARSKTASLSEGVAASRKARDLYKEQFQGGKRTLFELLDIQTAAYNAERAAIMNMFEERRAVYGVLSTMGIFPEAVKGEHHPMMAETKKPNKS